MNETPEPPAPFPLQPPPQPLPSRPVPSRRKPEELVPMEDGTGVGATIASLLKAPGSILYELMAGGRAVKLNISLLLLTLTGLMAFGVVTGSISWGHQLWIAPAKITGGLLFASLICLPSLYIFGALSGMALRLSAIAGMLLSTTALTALLVAGFTPLIWVFGQSTASHAFMGGLIITLWLFSLLFGLSLLVKCARALGMTDALHLRIWCFMFLLVTLQMSCALRPIIGTSSALFPGEKKFFLQHWADSIDAEKGNKKGGKPPVSQPEPD
jgi:hypothetical protein